MKKAFSSIFTLTVVLLAALIAMAVSAQQTGKKVETIDPSPDSFMPLKLGNSWTYRVEYTVKTDDPVMCRRVYELTSNGKNMVATCYGRATKTHTEKYSIVRHDGDHFFFTTEIDGKDQKISCRDGRYDDGKENCWTIWRKPGQFGLTESIKRNWTLPARQWLLEDREAPKDEYPIDNRNMLMFELSNGKIESNRIVYTYSGAFSLDYNTLNLTEVVVPAGKFANCIETIEKIIPDKKKKDDPGWETHTLFAPGVGIVREWQVKSDGTKTYEMVLIEFNAKGK
ncbi:MAG: hypothetical protein NTW50_00490 [Candidatus Berkelbacteria bacterium]|nr:hypothetical protein [Candidatus Berkelbacteria bacterium]